MFGEYQHMLWTLATDHNCRKYPMFDKVRVATNVDPAQKAVLL
jgi:hypothetical protein